MQAWFTDEQLLHDPQQYMRLGRICKPTDLPTRAEALLAALEARGVAVASPPDVGRGPIEAVHDTAYLDFLASAYPLWRAVRQFGLEPGIEVLPNLAPYAGAPLGAPRPPCRSTAIAARAGHYLGDLSCPIGPATWHSALRSAHTAIAAATAVAESGGSAYALCRPSGHHAHRDRASGFCYLNNTAIAAATLRGRHERVAVLDVDAHHGDGTQNIYYERGDVLTVSIHADPTGYFPFYTGYADERGAGAGLGCNLNLPVPHGADTDLFMRCLRPGLAAIRDFAPTALVVALGFDGHRDDPISVLQLDLDAFRQIGSAVATFGLPTVVVQEGGYLVEAIGPALDRFLSGLAA